MNFQAPRFALAGAPSQATLSKFMRSAQLHFGLASIHAMASTNQPQTDDLRMGTGTPNDASDRHRTPPTSPFEFAAITDEFAEQFFMMHRGDRRALQEAVRLAEELAATRTEAARLAGEIRRLEMNARAI